MSRAAPAEPRPAAAAESRRYDGAYFRDLLRQHRRPLLLANLLASLAALVSVVLPLLFPILVDEVILEQPAGFVAAIDRLFPPAWHGPTLYVLAVLGLTAVLRLAMLGLDVVQARQFAEVSKEIVYRLRCSLLRSLERISMREYETLGGGAVASRFVTDLQTLDQFLGASLSRLLVASLTLAAVAAALLWMHWPLALFIILLNPVVIFCTTLLIRRVKRLKIAENAAVETFQQALTEALEAIQQIRASNRERHYFLRLQDRAAQLRNRSVDFAWKSAAAHRFGFLVLFLGFDLFRALALLMVIFSDLTLGQMVAVFSYLWMMLAPAQELLRMQVVYYAARGALERINGLLDLEREPSYPHLENPFLERATVGIRLEHVSFSYGAGRPVLDDLSLEIAAGEKVAVLGASGGGKSTLVQILLGLYPTTSGTVRYGGVPITRIGMDVVREHVATVLQHPALFDDTVRNNLTLGRPRPEAALWKALEIAQLRDVVEGMREGLETIVGRQGIRLSGGQRQRLAIARMVLAEPRVVILDEATSAVDLETEARLYLALGSFLRGRTTILIAHRLSALRHADRVLVFEAGKVVEQGRHHELLARGGLGDSLLVEHSHPP